GNDMNAGHGRTRMESTHDPEQIWTSVLTNLLNDPSILNQQKGFLAGAMPKGMIGDSIYVLAAPSELHRRHLETDLREPITREIGALVGHEVTLAIAVGAGLTDPPAEAPTPQPPVAPAPPPVDETPAAEAPVGSPHPATGSPAAPAAVGSAQPATPHPDTSAPAASAPGASAPAASAPPAAPAHDLLASEPELGHGS